MSKLRSAVQKGKTSTRAMIETTKAPRKRRKAALKEGTLVMLRHGVVVFCELFNIVGR